MNASRPPCAALGAGSLLLLALAAPAFAAEPLSLDSNPMPLLDVAATGIKPPGQEQTQRMRSFEMPPVEVTAQREMKEEQLVGPNKQPRWTATRSYTLSRVYVVPEGKIEAEYWFIPRWRKDHSIDMRSLYELEFGLPGRLQFDLYFRTDQTVRSGNNDFLVGGQFEVRWALADWGVLPGNPTLYFEYIQLEERANRIEPKLLLGGELAPRWHWAANFVWEQEIGKASRSEGETELAWTGAISYTVFDSLLAVGVETELNLSNQRGRRSSWDTSLLIGPSFKVKPLPELTVIIAPLFGVTDQSPDARVYFNVGWEF